MNRDGCVNCKYVEYTGYARIMRCKLHSGDMVEPEDICGNYKLKETKDILKGVKE